jgi:hypothetical protein
VRFPADSKTRLPTMPGPGGLNPQRFCSLRKGLASRCRLIVNLMKRNALLLYAALSALLLLGLVFFHIQSLDGIHGRLLELALGADTEYARGYTDAAFASVRVGQTQKEVIDALGEPFTKTPAPRTGKERWMYSRSPTSIHYRYREVQLVDGIVWEKRNHFYID